MRSPVVRIALVVQVLLPVFGVAGANLAQARPASAEVADPHGIDADFNGDGYGDLAIGVPVETIGSVRGGGINVIYGSADGLSATATPDQFWSQDSPDVEGVAEEADLYGFALAAGNFGGTAKDDLAIGVPDEDIGSILEAGGINVLYGSATGLSATITPDQFWSQDTANVEDMSEEVDVLGAALAVGDFNGDSYADVAIGAQYEEINSSQGAGAVNVIYGSASGLSATATPDQFWHQDVGSVTGVAEPDDYLGYSLAAADFGSSSHDDLAMGVPARMSPM
jgi:FG-GAP repeat